MFCMLCAFLIKFDVCFFHCVLKKLYSKRKDLRRRVKGGAAQVNVEGRPVRSAHCSVLVEQSLPLLSLQDAISFFL